MKRLVSGALATVILAAVVACDPLATSNKSVTVASISDLHLPSPAVVIGQVMRDSLGNEAPLGLTAFDADGRVLLNTPIFINVLDSSVTIDQFGFVKGLFRDSIGARVVAGAGSLQTPQNRILVSVQPQVSAIGPAPTFINFTVLTDSSNQTNWSPPLQVTLSDVNLTGAQGFIVNYAIIRSPIPLTTGVPTVYLGDDAGKPTARDTTDHLGVATRRVILRQSAIGDQALLNGTKTDTIIIRATASYAGTVVVGMPIDFIIPVKKGP